MNVICGNKYGIAPLQGGNVLMRENPGRCPGLANSGPFGPAKSQKRQWLPIRPRHRFIMQNQRTDHPGVIPRRTFFISAPTGRPFTSEGQRPGTTAPNRLKSPERAKPTAMNLTILNFSENRQIQGATAFTGAMGTVKESLTVQSAGNCTIIAVPPKP
jgi:hypothetical protein